MKLFLACLFFVGACLFVYNRQHPFGRPAIPDGHDYTPEGVYALRTAYTVPAPDGPVQWKPGQQVFADRLAQTPVPAGTRLVTDGSHSAAIPASMLSEDVQEGAMLRQATTEAQNQAEAQAQALAQAEARAQQARLREAAEAKAQQDRLLEAQLRKPAPTPKFGHTALDEPARPARANSYFAPRNSPPGTAPTP